MASPVPDAFWNRILAIGGCQPPVCPQKGDRPQTGTHRGISGLSVVDGEMSPGHCVTRGFEACVGLAGRWPGRG